MSGATSHDDARARHSVEQHLSLDPVAYDREIRRLVPHYDEMIAEGVTLLRALAPADARVLDLGGGTGALSEAVLSALPGVQVILLDVDPAMLARARTRLERFGARVTFHPGRFEDALPECDAVVASLSLHHIESLAAKAEVYAAIARRLPPGGPFLNLDAMASGDPALAELMYARWAAAMGAHGIDEATARGHFAAWANEDHYRSVHVELGLLAAAGFAEPECFWRRGQNGIVGGRAGAPR